MTSADRAYWDLLRSARAKREARERRAALARERRAAHVRERIVMGFALAFWLVVAYAAWRFVWVAATGVGP